MKCSQTRNCKVISLYLGERRRWPLEPDGMISVANQIINREVNVDVGVPMDTILVISESGHPYENDLLALDGISTKKGTLHAYRRVNNGLSFGAYNDAYERYNEDYDYWWFTEDDVIGVKDGYYARAMEDLDSSDKVAFIAAIGIGDKWGKHAHGGVGLTHVKYLREAYEKNGTLPFYPGEINIEEARKSPSKSKAQVWPHLEHGEVAFTNIYEKLGYKIAMLSMKEAVYDVERNTYHP